MLPVEISSLQTRMTTTGPGVREPVSGQPIPVNLIDLVIVPGMGFTESGHRIGRGMGFYDRFLAQPDFIGVSCGLGFEEQIVPELPVLDHDMPLSMLCTDRGIGVLQPIASARNFRRMNEDSIWHFENMEVLVSRQSRRLSRFLLAILLVSFSAAALSFIYKMNHQTSPRWPRGPCRSGVPPAQGMSAAPVVSNIPSTGDASRAGIRPSRR